MGYWKQDKKFNLAKMGKKQGYCLQNVRLAYGIGSKFASAKANMEASKKADTLHDAPYPSGVAVPLFSSAGQYGHVMVYDDGKYYSDGKKVSSINTKNFKWSETLNGVRVVSYVDTTRSIKVGDKVTLVKLVDYNGRGLRKTRNFYFVKQIKGDRVVLTADSVNGPVYAAVKKSNLKKV